MREGRGCVREEEGDREKEGKRIKEKGKRKEEKGRDLKEKEKDPSVRWKDLKRKREEGRRVAARCRGWERKTARGNPRVWRLGGLGPGFGLLSRALELLFSFCEINLAINFRKRRRLSR